MYIKMDGISRSSPLFQNDLLHLTLWTPSKSGTYLSVRRTTSSDRKTSREGAGFMIYTAASHRGAIEMIWLHFRQLPASSIFK